MKLFFLPFGSRRLHCRLLVLLACAVSTVMVNAQEKPKQVTPAQSKQAFKDAIGLFKAKDFKRADEVLFGANRSHPGSLAWQLESVGKLMGIALSLRHQYDAPGAQLVAQRALAMLEDAEKTARKESGLQQARVHEMAGFLYDELLRDEQAAYAAYEKALRANPASKRAIQELARLDEAKEQTKRLNNKR